jgi:2-polyprenyl-3-methyl-5-hydroxy-6-metoxy-1,4-benzoquinol methylase
METTKLIPKEHTEDQKYSDYIQPYNQNIFEIIDSRLNSIDPNWFKKKILDFGCNVGHLLGYSNGKITDYTGVDVQEKPLNIAKKLFPNNKWICYNGYHPAFNSNGTETFPNLGNEKYDYIICIGVFTHCDLEQIDYLATEFKKHLSINGRIIFSLWETMHWELYARIFLLEKFGIKLSEDVFKEFNQSIYLVDRDNTITDTHSFPSKEMTWVETFYNRKFILEHFPTARVLDGMYTKHTIYMI